MNLDDNQYFSALDSQKMINDINGLPLQLQQAWNEGSKKAITNISSFDTVVIAGMGGSAIGADLMAGYISDFCPIPVSIHRDYGLPAWAGKRTLVVLSSHSGNTEETLSAFIAAHERGCSVVTISRGGQLTRMATEKEYTAWTFQHDGQPRAAVGFSFGLLLALFRRLGLIPDQGEFVSGAVEIMQAQQKNLLPEAPTHINPAKRLAGQLIGRNIVVMASGCLAPVARRYKGQVNELSKAWSQFEFLPEANHNTLAGVENPSDLLSHMVVLFLRGDCDRPQNRLRADMTREVFMQQGVGTDTVDAKGDHPLANIWSLLHFGDYMTYYLAMAYQVDPGPIVIMDEFKLAVRNARD